MAAPSAVMSSNSNFVALDILIIKVIIIIIMMMIITIIVIIIIIIIILLLLFHIHPNYSFIFVGLQGLETT